MLGDCEICVVGFSIVFSSKFEKTLNVTFIAHIPKKLGTLELKVFGSISLVNRVYKTISKVLANHEQCDGA